MSNETNDTFTKPRRASRKRRNYAAEMAALEMRINLVCELLHGGVTTNGDCSGQAVKLALALLERPAGS